MKPITATTPSHPNRFSRQRSDTAYTEFEQGEPVRGWGYDLIAGVGLVVFLLAILVMTGA